MPLFSVRTIQTNHRHQNIFFSVRKIRKKNNFADWKPTRKKDSNLSFNSVAYYKQATVVFLNWSWSVYCCNSISSSVFARQDTFFTQSELIEPVSPQAAQLGIHFYIFFSSQRWNLVNRLDWWKKVGMDRKKTKNKSPAPGGIQTNNLQITRCVLYSLAKIAAQGQAHSIFLCSFFLLPYLALILVRR